MQAWNDWYHLNGNTYGTWLRGDPRGFRTRHHREHVEGDYKNPPPPGSYDALHARSKTLMRRPPVRLPPEARRIACDEIVASLAHQGIEVVCACVDDHHFHVLARFRLPEISNNEKPTGLNPWASPRRTRNSPIHAHIRHIVGFAKSRAARALSEAGLVHEGGVWGKRFKITPVTSRAHQVNIARYILDHGPRGAAVWRRDPTCHRPLPGA